MRRVLIAGSFDPVTLGHTDLIRRAAGLFDRVTVGMFINAEKTYLLDADTRLRMLTAACLPFPNVEVIADGGYVVDFCRREGIDCLLRGVRDERDLAYEQVIAAYNREHGGLETVLLIASPAVKDISSTAARKAIRQGDDLTSLIPAEALREMERIQGENMGKTF